MSILSELASKFRAVPADELARVFLRIENQRVAEQEAAGGKPGARPAPPRTPSLSHSPLPIDPIRIAGVLGAIHDAQLRIHATHVDSYQDLWRRLRSFETHLREQASIVDTLMSKVAPVQAAPAAGSLQQTVLLQCPRGGFSAGRFRCLNRFAETVEVTIEGGTVCGFTAEGSPVSDAAARAEPAHFSLEPGAKMTVRLMLDVGRADTRDMNSVSAAFDVRMNGRPHSRVWLEAELYDEEF